MKKIFALFAAVLVLASCSASGGETVATKDKTTTTEGGEKTTTTKGEPDPDPEPDPEPTPTTEGKKTTTTEKKKGGGKGGIEVTDAGYTAYRDYSEALMGTAGAALENGGSSTIANFEVIFTFRDKAKKVVGTDTAYVYAIGADGGVAYAEVNNVDLQGDPASVEAVAVVDEEMADYYEGTVLEVTVDGVTIDEYSGPVVKGTAKNPGKTVIKGGTVDCVLLSKDKIVGGASAYLDTLTPGGEVAWDTYGYYEDLKADKAKCSGGSYD